MLSALFESRLPASACAAGTLTPAISSHLAAAQVPSVPTHPESGSAPAISRLFRMPVAASWQVFGPSGFAGSVRCSPVLSQ